MTDQTRRLEIATVRAEIGSNITFRFNNDAIDAGGIPTESGDIKNLKLIIKEIEDKASVSTTIYPTVSTGLAATTEGWLFLVASAGEAGIYDLWKKVGGVAVDTGKRALSSQAAQEFVEAAQASATEAAASAISAQNAAESAASDFQDIFEADQIEREQEFADLMEKSGYESVYLIYGEDIVIERQTQLIQREGELYRAMNASDVPLTMTGIWATDAPKLKAVGDASLRADLSENSADLIRLNKSFLGAINRSLGSILSEDVSINDFGGPFADTADITSALNAAIAYHNSKGGIDFLNVKGTRISIPQGRYSVGQLAQITRSGCDIVGASKNSTVLLLSSASSTFRYGNGVDIVVGGDITNMKLEYPSTPAVGAKVVTYSLAYRCGIHDCLVANIGTLASMGTSASAPAGGISITNVDGSKANVACYLYEFRWGAGFFENNNHIFATVPHPVHPASMTTVPGCGLYQCISGFWDTMQSTNCLYERFDIGLGISAGSGMVYQNFYSNNIIMDYFRRYTVYLESSAGGVISGIRFGSESWFVSWETNSIEIAGAGYNDDHHFGGRVVIAGGAAVQCSSPNAKDLSFQAMQVNSCNRLGTANAAMNFSANSRGFTVNGCRGNVDTTGVGFPWRAPYGISVGANCDDFVVGNNGVKGSTAPYQFSANASPSVDRWVGGNSSANYAAQIPLSLAGSGVAIYNTTPFSLEVEINGGTVTGLSKLGVALPNKTSGSITLDPGQYFTPSYSSAPTLVAFARA